MSKTKQDGDETVEPVNSAEQTSQFFFPPQDGREAFMCEATNQTDANAQYAASSSEK